MKKFFILFFMSLMLTTSYAYVINPTPENNPEVKEIMASLEDLTLDDVLSMTPKKYKEITGKRMKLKEMVALKVAKKKLKKFTKGNNSLGEAKISKALYIVLAIFGWGFIGMGINDSWKGKDWIICLVLGFFTCIGGLIYALVKKKNYYS